MFYRWIFFILIIGLTQWYSFQCIKTFSQNKYLRILYINVSLLIIVNFIFQIINYDRSEGFTHMISYSLGFFISLFVFQFIIIIGLIFEDIIRFPQALYSFFNQGITGQDFFPQRRKFISQITLTIASIPFGALLYGMYRGKYNYKVSSYELEFDDLPVSFDGFKLTHISDIHCGSFDNPEKVKYGIDLINKQESDVIMFTGDLVNNVSKELNPWKDLFSSLKAEHGVYSILGNHDYGDYMNWDNDQDKINNLDNLKKIQNEMGFKLLLNENDFIIKNGEKLAVIGVENWGAGGFKKSGDLNKAIEGVSNADFKILLSHDPSHWNNQVVPHNFIFPLTLSGHTHGMQFGIDIPGWIKWSPIKWRYPEFAGLYQKAKQYLYVNRGFGYLAYPGRVGMWPEITVITLKKRKIDV
ncbi:MAG: putative MPP superfamily phosphohydrolase [Candidatus Marivariicella framensis]|jgi:predicted MPP superfamily phosphohydrolase